MEFKQKHPLSAREAVYTPMILRNDAFNGSSLPFPSLRGIRDFAAYCGISDGAVRTALSRARAEGEIQVFQDASQVTRYCLVESMMNMGRTITDRPNRAEGFILAVFSFKSDQETERGKVRETLKYYGFKKLAQNTYINGRIETSGLKEAMQKFGLKKNLYLFDCPSVDDAELINKILSVFKIGERRKYLLQFHQELADFLLEKNLDPEEIVHRICYAGPVHWTICNIDEPPFPQKYLPDDYPLRSISQLYNEVLESHREIIMKHYRMVNG
jgi:DNA-binding transcriptional regulator PaaX